MENDCGIWWVDGTHSDGVMNNNQQDGMDLIQLNFLLNI